MVLTVLNGQRMGFSGRITQTRWGTLGSIKGGKIVFLQTGRIRFHGVNLSLQYVLDILTHNSLQRLNRCYVLS